MSKIIQAKCRVLSNRKVGPDYFEMAIYAPRIVQQAMPGQFVHLRCQNSAEPLLRRPLSFHRLNQNNFEILYKVVGRGTNLLAKKRKDDKIDVLGPLGKGFDIKRFTPVHRSLGEGGNDGSGTTILVAGGMGVAPLFALAEKLAGRKNIFVLIGAKAKDSILCAGDFKKLGVKVQVATDNGSLGYKGFVTDLLNKILRYTKYDIRNTIYACGPKSMLKKIACISHSQRIFAYASLEENMACGLGACLGCAIRTKGGYKRVCKDGPVFNLQEIKW